MVYKFDIIIFKLIKKIQLCMYFSIDCSLFGPASVLYFFHSHRFDDVKLQSVAINKISIRVSDTAGNGRFAAFATSSSPAVRICFRHLWLMSHFVGLKSENILKSASQHFVKSEKSAPKRSLSFLRFPYKY